MQNEEKEVFNIMVSDTDKEFKDAIDDLKKALNQIRGSFSEIAKRADISHQAVQNIFIRYTKHEQVIDIACEFLNEWYAERKEKTKRINNILAKIQS